MVFVWVFAFEGGLVWGAFGGWEVAIDPGFGLEFFVGGVFVFDGRVPHIVGVVHLAEWVQLGPAGDDELFVF